MLTALFTKAFSSDLSHAQSFPSDSKHFPIFPAGCVQGGSGGGDCGSLNTVLLCGCSLECFCERARATHHGETTHATGSSPKSDLSMMGNVEFESNKGTGVLIY